MVDASGAIYVIGGYDSGTTDFNDVWASTDGGARLDSVGGAVGGVHWVGTTGVTKWYYVGLLRGTNGVLTGYLGVLGGY